MEARAQAEAIYSALCDALAAAGGSYSAVVAETVFLRDLRVNLGPVRAARSAVVSSCNGLHHDPARSEIEQPPLDGHACLEVLVHAVVPHRPTARIESIEATSTRSRTDGAPARAVLLRLGDEFRLHAGGLYGAGANAYQEALAMFGQAEQLLQQAGMSFRDVVRTWIYLRHMERDYPALNRARREFYTARRIHPAPASTGIHAGLISSEHDFALALYAVHSGRPIVRTAMSSRTLNEAPEYGADFTRGLKVVETNRVALHVSGTASVDEQGRTAHAGDLDAQADRMLVNIAALLEGRGADFGDVVSAVTYLKHPADAARLRRRLRDAGFAGFPHVLVAADICRADLLCETEALAVLPIA